CPSQLILSINGCASSLDGGSNNLRQFAIFSDNSFQLGGGNQRSSLNQLQPNCCFIQFLHDNSQLMYKIRSTFSSARFAIVCRGSSARSKNLSGYMPTLCCFG